MNRPYYPQRYTRAAWTKFQLSSVRLTMTRRTVRLLTIAALLCLSNRPYYCQQSPAGRAQTPPPFLFINAVDGKIGLIDGAGKVSIRPQFETSVRSDAHLIFSLNEALGGWKFSEGLARVTIDERLRLAEFRDRVASCLIPVTQSHRQRRLPNTTHCVAGMSKAISDSAAISFAAYFYQAFGYGRDIKTAFKWVAAR
jgi:hypothetical protein